MYQVLARKWRPQSFETLVGQPHVSRTLHNALQEDRLAHAYIFSGVRGTGKTSAARILAKCLNCEQGPTPTPCNRCAPCIEIAEGRAIDVLEIDAASRTKVEQTRELLETLSYAPTRDRYKVLIIDEVHMLSKSSFNALLKTLEEPPPRVLFILATTERHKILPTIVSRCQVFEFRRVLPGELSAHLRRICDEEGVEISDASLDRIARYGEGSIRDSLSILERVLAFCGLEVTDEDVLAALGAVRTEVLVRLVRGLAERDAAAMLFALDETLAEGRDLLHLWSEWIGVLRDLQIARAAPGRNDLLSRTPEEASDLEEAAEPLSREDLNRAFEILAALEYPLKSSAQPRFLFESAVIRLAALGAVRPIEEVLAELRVGGGLPPPTGGAGGGGADPPRGGSRPAQGRGGRPSPRPSRTSPPTTRSQGGNGTGSRAAFESEICATKPMLGGILRHAGSIRREDDTLVIAFGPDDDLWVQQIDRDDYREVLRSTGKARFGTSDVRIVREETPVAATGPSSGANGAASPPREKSRQELMTAATSDPAVRNLLREFGAQVVDIRPLAAAPGTSEGGDVEGAAEDGA